MNYLKIGIPVVLTLIIAFFIYDYNELTKTNKELENKVTELKNTIKEKNREIDRLKRSNEITEDVLTENCNQQINKLLELNQLQESVIGDFLNKEARNEKVQIRPVTIKNAAEDDDIDISVIIDGMQRVYNEANSNKTPTSFNSKLQHN